MTSTGPQPISTIAPEDVAQGAGANVMPDGDHARKKGSWLEGFRRITTSGEFIPEIDGLRFIAITVVVFRHIGLFVYIWLLGLGLMKEEGLLNQGMHGVELFFVISGFILSTPFALHSIQKTRPVKLKRYFLRRVTRLEPPYLLSLIIMFALKVILDPGKVHWRDLFLSTFYISNLAIGTSPQISSVAWSLEIEIQFYVLMPLLAMLYWIGHRWLRRAAIVGVAAGFIYFQPVLIPGYLTGQPYVGNILNFIQYFLAGLLLSDVYATEWGGAPPVLRTRGIMWGDIVWLIGWPVLLYLFVIGDPEHIGGSTLAPFVPIDWKYGDLAMRAGTPAVIFILYLSLFKSVWARKLIRLEVITIIGGMCYSIYLLHNVICKSSLPLLKRWLPHNFWAAFWIDSLFAIPAVLIVCGIYFRLIERPCMRPDWPKRLVAWIKKPLDKTSDAGV